MNYNGIKLTEMTPEQWDGKSREMLVWYDDGKKPEVSFVVGFTQKGNPLTHYSETKKYTVYPHCADIPLFNDREHYECTLKPEFNYPDDFSYIKDNATVIARWNGERAAFEVDKRCDDGMWKYLFIKPNDCLTIVNVDRKYIPGTKYRCTFKEGCSDNSDGYVIAECFIMPDEVESAPNTFGFAINGKISGSEFRGKFYVEDVFSKIELYDQEHDTHEYVVGKIYKCTFDTNSTYYYNNKYYPHENVCECYKNDKDACLFRLFINNSTHGGVHSFEFSKIEEYKNPDLMVGTKYKCTLKSGEQFIGVYKYTKEHGFYFLDTKTSGVYIIVSTGYTMDEIAFVETYDEIVPEPRLATYRELYMWLTSGKGEVATFDGSYQVTSNIEYNTTQSDEPCTKYYVRKKGDSDWHQPRIIYMEIV